MKEKPEKKTKKLAVILVLFVTMTAIVSCPDIGGGGNSTTITKKFWAQNMNDNTFYQLDAEKLASNSICEVWAQKESGVTTATANSVANAYSTVYTKMMNTFGYRINVMIGSSVINMNIMELAHYLATEKTSDAKLTILLLDIKDGYTTDTDPYIAGYFYAGDLFKNDPNYPQYKSNELDMIYLDTHPSVPGSPESNGTLAHEMQHLMNFVSNVVIRSDEDLILMDTWINEGLSGAAEWVYSGEHPEGRLKNYNEDWSKLICKGNNFYMWDNHKGESPYANLDDYATAYLFFQYLRLQSGNPDKIYYDIHTAKYSDYRAVTTADNINTAHKNNWQLLLRDWHAANFTNAASGLYGYKNDPILRTVKAPMVPYGFTTLPLYPGEGVYSRTTTAESVPTGSGYIKYAGLNSGSGIPNETTGFANGARLTYNIDTNTEGLSVPGSTTGIAPSVGISVPGNGSVQISSNKFSGPFKVDMGYFSRRNGNSGVPDKVIKSAFNKNNGGGRSVDSGTTIKFDLSTLERVFIDE